MNVKKMKAFVCEQFQSHPTLPCMDCGTPVHFKPDPTIQAEGGKVKQYVMCGKCYTKSLKDSP